ncbi:MAG: DinB family protein [Planctomycetota bacterium]|jgi:hypothetical protein
MDPTARALLVLLDNQEARTAAALEGLDASLVDTGPGGDCHGIRDIVRHLVALRRFQLTLLESPRAESVRDVGEAASFEELVDVLHDSTRLVRVAIEEHDPEDWYAHPDPPREGKWGDEPTIVRFGRPFNDLVNHLGSIRTIRRMHGNPAERTQ